MVSGKLREDRGELGARMRNCRNIFAALACKSFLLFLIFSGFLAMGSMAASETLTIGQVFVNKPEVTVFFDMPGEAHAGQLSAEARLGGEALTAVSIEPFVASGEGVWYFFVVDCSTSITAQQIGAIRGAITEVAEGMGSGDRVTIITFGVTVDVLINLSGDIGEITAAAASLQANQRGTLFYDAIIETLDIGNRYGDGIPERRAAFIFSDAEDYNVGGFVKEEVDARLENASIAIYAIGLNNNTRVALDAFGAMARLSGGAIDVVTHSTLQDAVIERAASLKSGYVARFSSKTNVISGGQEELALTVALGGASYSAEAFLTPSRWIPDNVQPHAESAEQTAPGTVSIRFDKPMLGADLTNSFRIEDEHGDLLALRTVSYDDATYTATLTFAEQPQSGEITISFPGVTDASMEKNTLAESVTIEFRGAERSPPVADTHAQSALPDPVALPDMQTSGEPINPAVWLFASIIIAIIVVAVTLGIIKSRGGLVRVDGKLRFAGPVRQEVFVAEESIEAVQYQFVTSKPPELRLRVIDASGNSRDLSTPVSGSLFIGRGAGNDLAFDDPRMSRQHFVIEAKDGGFTIQNLSETSETFLNGVPLGAPYPLSEGDKVSAGNITFVMLGVV